MDAKGTIRSGLPIHIEDEGLPMHADIVYAFSPTPGIPSPIWVKKAAKELAKQPPAKYLNDPAPDKEKWAGGKF